MVSLLLHLTLTRVPQSVSTLVWEEGRWKGNWGQWGERETVINSNFEVLFNFLFGLCYCQGVQSHLTKSQINLLWWFHHPIKTRGSGLLENGLDYMVLNSVTLRKHKQHIYNSPWALSMSRIQNATCELSGLTEQEKPVRDSGWRSIINKSLLQKICGILG